MTPRLSWRIAYWHTSRTHAAPISQWKWPGRIRIQNRTLRSCLAILEPRPSWLNMDLSQSRAFSWLVSICLTVYCTGERICKWWINGRNIKERKRNIFFSLQSDGTSWISDQMMLKERESSFFHLGKQKSVHELLLESQTWQCFILLEITLRLEKGRYFGPDWNQSTFWHLICWNPSLHPSIFNNLSGVFLRMGII